MVLENVNNYSSDIYNSFDVLKLYYDKWIAGKRNTESYLFTDHFMNGYSLLYLNEHIQSEKYVNMIENLLRSIINFSLKNGSIPYSRIKINNLDNILTDGIAMTCPFLCRCMTIEELRKYNSVELAISALENFLNYGIDTYTGLPYHAYNPETFEKLGIIGWGRGTAWLLIGLADSLEFINKTHPKYSFLVDKFSKLIKEIIKYQRGDGYFSWQLSAREGPKDTSATSMISYTITKGILLGILSNELIKVLDKSKTALCLSIRENNVYDSLGEAKDVGEYPQKYSAYPWSLGPTVSFFALYKNLLSK
jgi:rhamnogalacturonyl hydrolase YesR